jgi:glycyl-tRNA synthetase beta chain
LDVDGFVAEGSGENVFIIRDAANSAATAVGGIAHIDEDLLAEIAALNEY